MSDLVAYKLPESKSNDDDLNFVADEIQELTNLPLEEGIILCPDANFQCKEGECVHLWGCVAKPNLNVSISIENAFIVKTH
jgi:hypothetical protein